MFVEYFYNRVSAALVPRKKHDLDTLTSFDFHALQIFEEVHKKVAKFPYHNTNLINTQKMYVAKENMPAANSLTTWRKTFHRKM